MRVLALDIGKVRTGIAVSDPQASVASPVCVLPTKDLQDGAANWQRVLQDWEPEKLVVGLPLSMDGKPHAQANRIQAIAKQLAQAAVLPIEFIDERLSSQEAKRILHEEGMSEQEMRGKVDMIAASIFLQTWLDEQRLGSQDNTCAAHIEAGEMA